jgi:hypothetical protein
MTATYQLKASGLTQNFLDVLKKTFAGQDITVRVETRGSEGPLKREGWIVPKGEEDDPFYSEANLRFLNKNIKDMEEGKFVTKTFEELFGDLK